MQFLTTGGPFLWLVLLFAAVAVVFASRYPGSAKRRHATAALGLATCATIVSLLSLATGFQRAVGPLRAGNEAGQKLIFLGISEALNGPILALIACFLVGVLLTTGAYRGGQQRRARVLATEADEMAV